MKSKPIETVVYHKHLGLTYETKMTFNIHCNDIFKKAFSKFNFLKFVSKKADGMVFLKLYKSFILPIIEFSNLSFVPNKCQSELLESIQKKITKYICYRCGKYDLNYDQRLEFLKLKKLKIRRHLNALKLVQKIKLNYNDIPNDWLNYFTFYNTTRNGIKLKTNFRRIDIINKNFFNHCIQLFNDLPILLRNEDNFKNFVNNLFDVLI